MCVWHIQYSKIIDKMLWEHAMILEEVGCKVCIKHSYVAERVWEAQCY